MGQGQKRLKTTALDNVREIEQCQCWLSVNFVFRICLTKLDILDSFDEVKIGVEYQLNGKTLDYYPSCLSELSSVKVLIILILISSLAHWGNY